MSRVDLMGCRVSYTELNVELGIPYSIECSVEEGSIGDSFSLIMEYANMAAGILSEMLGSEIHLGGPEGWEFIGRRFNLYKFPLLSSSGRVGILRVVEAGGHIVSIAGAFYKDSERTLEALARAKSGETISYGENLGVTFLDSSNQGEPYGQKHVNKAPIYAAEGVPNVNPDTWTLKVTGAVDYSRKYNLRELLEIATSESADPMHCVTGWSLIEKTWRGIPLNELLGEAGPRPRAKWLAAISVKGYSAVIPLDEALDSGMLVLYIDDTVLPKESGYPARLFLPRLYGWKHVKWVTELRVLETYMDGYWEALAYHERGMVLAEERFKVRNKVIKREGRLPGPGRPLKPSHIG